MYKVYLQKGPTIRTDEELNSTYFMLQKAARLASKGIEPTEELLKPTEMDKYDYSGMKHLYLVENNKCVFYISCGITTELGFDESKEHENLILLEDFATQDNYYGSEVIYKADYDAVLSVNLLYKKDSLILFEDADGLLVPEHISGPVMKTKELSSRYSDYDYILDRLQKQIDDQGLPYKLK